ncbi:MAG: heavy metal translocating P-type ATPase metal-binding domain-containing protein, partial [Saprospiraceae bacterium]|nr:heavy metal translocating P-type ATPase metal-binding domain-containing protein [Saprospiraceae bacterium]
MSATTKEQLACFHCGEDCPDDTIRIEDKLFCCHGCKTVFEILNAHELTQYYTIQDRPGISRRGKRQELYTWLDDDEIAAKLVDFRDERL